VKSSCCFRSWAFLWQFQECFRRRYGQLQDAKSTSADRFAVLKNGMSRSVSSAGIGRDRAVPLLWSSSQGGVGMLPHAPKGDYSTQRARSSRSGRRLDKPSTGPSSTSHFSSPSLPLNPSHLLSAASLGTGSGHTPLSDPVPNNLLVKRKVLHWAPFCQILIRLLLLLPLHQRHPQSL